MSDGIAIIGAAGRFPGARNLEEFWRNLCNGVNCISLFSEDEALQAGVKPEIVRNPNYVKARGILSDMAWFDAEFFGFSPREADITDPQQRHFMECAWEALENAGYDPATFGGPIGMYAGSSLSNYLFLLTAMPDLVESMGNFQIEIGNDKDFLATRTSYKLNLSGPSVNVNTACSTSLVAVCLACQSLENHQCDLALAGGVSITIPQYSGYMYHQGGILSPDGHCRAYDAKAQGTVGGTGAGVVVLKRAEEAVEDGDEVIAVIKGYAINNDGGQKVGFTAPSVEGQAAVISEALANAGVSAETVTYVEGHGTGTQLGDPIEVAALTRAFRRETGKKQYCGLGSVKSNIGHLDAAAGVAGLIKAALAVKEGKIPGTLHYEEGNGAINFGESPFYVNGKLAEWKREGGVRRAGVSSFGIGGTNAHVVLEEGPGGWKSSGGREKQLLVLSGRNEGALEEGARRLREHLAGGGEWGVERLADAAYTLGVGRKGFAHRLAVVCGSAAEAMERLKEERGKQAERAGQVQRGRWTGGRRTVAVLLSGQGSQYVQMGRELYGKERVFREEIDWRSEWLKGEMGLDVREVMYAEGEEEERRARELLRQTWVTQPALYVLERALLKQWESWGVEIGAMLGHSLGEVVAASAAGVMSEEEGLKLVAARGRLMWETRRGGMLSALLGEEEARRYERKGVEIGAVNGREQVVFTGGEEELAEVEGELKSAGVAVKRLEVERAFHSERMEAVRERYLEVVKGIRLRKPEKRYMSNVTGRWAGDEVCEAEYWWEQMRRPVRFAAGVEEMVAGGERVWLEIGPGESLGRLVGQEMRRQGDKGTVVASLGGEARKGEDQEQMIRALGKLWVEGVGVDWKRYYGQQRRRRIPLPTYPFQRQRYWIQEPDQVATTHRNQDAAGPNAELKSPASHSPAGMNAMPQSPPLPMEAAITEIWKQLLGIDEIGVNDNFFELGGHSLMAVQMVGRLRDKLRVEVPLERFLEEPTIEGMVKRAQSPGSRAPERSVLVGLRTSGTNPPFFAVHPIGGGAFIFRNLAQHLGPDQPFYGLQALELAEIGEEGDPYLSLEDMAARYLHAVRSVQPVGPYFLGGHSWGGVLAFEMAQQLTRKGEEIRLLALFDTPSPAELSKLDALDDAGILVGLARDLGFQRGVELPLSVDDIRVLQKHEQLDRVIKALQKFGLLPADADARWLQRHLQGYRSRLRFVRNYRPEIYPGQLTFFRAADLDEVMTEDLDRLKLDYNSPVFAWDKLSSEPIQLYVVPGNHSEIMFEPHVQTLAERVSACIAKAIATPCVSGCTADLR